VISHAPHCGTRLGAPVCTCGAIGREAARLARDYEADQRFLSRAPNAGLTGPICIDGEADGSGLATRAG
jgi:hypothetical protein